MFLDIFYSFRIKFSSLANVLTSLLQLFNENFKFLLGINQSSKLYLDLMYSHMLDLSSAKILPQFEDLSIGFFVILKSPLLI